MLRCTSTKLPSAQQFRRQMFIAKIRTAEPSRRAARNILMPDHVFESLLLKWRNWTKLPEHPETEDDFFIDLELHEARAGFVTAFFHYDRGVVIPGVAIEAEKERNDVELEGCDDLDPPSDEQEIDWLKHHVWMPAEQSLRIVETIRGTKKAKPNEKCPCGSGKKHKKCCGR